jgi:hypothetical protein
MRRTVGPADCSPLFESNRGAQVALFHDSMIDAVGAAVQAAGGVKRVASQLWPALDSVSAAAKLRACLNADQPHKLSLDELQFLMRLARAAGDLSILRYLAMDLGCELQVLQPEEAKRKAKAAREIALLEELLRLKREQA